jgi:hypothetical protein
LEYVLEIILKSKENALGFSGGVFFAASIFFALGFYEFEKVEYQGSQLNAHDGVCSS